MNFVQRPRRLRDNEVLRKMVRETRMNPSSLVYPVFIKEGTGMEEEIKSMEGQYRYSVDRLMYKLEELSRAGVDKILLFGLPDKKDACASSAYEEDGVIQRALRAIKSSFPQLYCITDVCMCEYTSHGHCGILKGDTVDNDATLDYLAKIALSHAEAGADMIAPSDMMDGRVGAIRKTLDSNQLERIPIMSYAVKYASAFYGPFREAAGSAPAFGDRKTYQMDCHNKKEALREVILDTGEGADIIMVKPALAYQDVICEVAKLAQVPVAAYSVSGEYAMVKAAAKAGYLRESDIVCEMAVGAFRAGANIYVTYFATELAGYMREGRLG